jgi:hypothetical protein
MPQWIIKISILKPPTPFAFTMLLAPLNAVTHDAVGVHVNVETKPLLISTIRRYFIESRLGSLYFHFSKTIFH